MMNKKELKDIWKSSIQDLLGTHMEDDLIDVLAMQTIDSIRRIQIYQTYAHKAAIADEKKLSFYHTNNPFTLVQRNSLSHESKVWYIYLATYFGKSDKSKWSLFNKASFQNENLIQPYTILKNRTQYYNYLKGLDFFEGMNYSNHRKYTKKSLDEKGGVIYSMNYFLDNINNYALKEKEEFDAVYRKAMRIPNFGRMAAFDFTSSMCKCSLNVNEPISMYHKHSTGPLRALRDIMVLSKVKKVEKKDQIVFGDNLLNWFIQNTNIYLIAQVLEDAICNWQKSHRKYKKFFG